MEKGVPCPDEELRRLLTYPEIRERVLKLSKEPVPLSRSVSKRALVKYSSKVDAVRALVVRDVVEPLEALKKVIEFRFYREIASNVLQGQALLDDLIGKLLGKLRRALSLSREYKRRISVSFDSTEAREAYREYVGRVLSIVRRVSKEIELANKVIAELRRTPCVDPSAPVVVVAGLPQVGKSTLVAAISTAKPKSSPFPFTTKEIIMGHVSLSFRLLQILDLPGILDRPPEEMNEIERRAFAAIASLADVIVYLIDPSEDFYYGLEPQLRLLKFIKGFAKAGLVVALNKMDKVSPERAEKVLTMVSEIVPGVEVVKISALRRVGLSELISAVAKCLDRTSELEKPIHRESQDQGT